MNLGERLRSLRLSHGWPLHQVAEAVGISVPYLSELERGNANGSLDTLARIAYSYDLTLQELLSPLPFYGKRTGGALPRGVAQLQAEPVFGQALDDEDAELLARIEYRGRRLQRKEDAFMVLRQLRRILNGTVAA